uniref:Uncharacterized protein n=1 Tax=candidate division WOR-3 bacterium TaxID=2052148 RepID=A0A7C4U7A2_UNCW3
MRFFEKILKIDRRWIFLIVGIVVIIPLIFPIGMPVLTTPPVRSLYNYVDKLQGTGKAVMLVTDFDPSTMPELLPMACAILRHCFAKKIPVYLYGGLYSAYVGMAEMALEKTLPDFPDLQYGKDYIFLGYVPGVSLVILGMGGSISGTFNTDYYGNKLDTLPLNKMVDNYKNIGIVIDLSGSASPETWVIYGYQRFGVRIGVGTTAVSAAQYYPMLQTGQFVGMLGGLKGAAEYEQLIKKAGIPTGRLEATIGMDAQSFVHIFLIFIIILGNIAFLITKKRKV